MYTKIVLGFSLLFSCALNSTPQKKPKTPTGLKQKMIARSSSEGKLLDKQTGKKHNVGGGNYDDTSGTKTPLNFAQMRFGN